MTHVHWQFLHILLFVFWLGGDVGVFMSMLFVKDRRLAFATRATIIKLAFYVDLFPRVAFALILPVGVMLAMGVGALPQSGLLRLAAWLVGVAWAVLHVVVVWRKGTPLAARLRRANVVFEALMGALLVAAGVASLLGLGPVVMDWFALKLVLFGLVFWVVLGIDVRFQPFTMLLAAGAEGLTEERERAISRATNQTLAWACLLYSLIVAIAYLGKLKPI